MKNTKFTEPWFVKKASYALVGLAVLVLGGLGLIPQDQLDPVVNQIGGLTSGALLLLATSETHRGSADPTTVEDLEAVKAETQHDDAATVKNVLSAMEEINTYGKHASGAVTDAVDSAVSDVRSYYEDRNQV